MPPTRINAEQYLVGRLGGKLAFVGKSTAVDGANADLNGPMVMAATTLNYHVADWAALSDADIALFVNVPAWFGLAELFALRDIWGCMTDVTESGQDRTQEWSAMSAEIGQAIARLEALYRTLLQAFRPIVTGTLRVPVGRRGGPEL